jgi:hypothetical protein
VETLAAGKVEEKSEKHISAPEARERDGEKFYARNGKSAARQIESCDVTERARQPKVAMGKAKNCSSFIKFPGRPGSLLSAVPLAVLPRQISLRAR